MTLKFTALHHQMQPENSLYPTADGKVWNFYFEDAAGNEKVLSQNSTNSLFYKAARAARIEPGETITISRTGTGTDTKWSIIREGEAAPAKEDMPF